MANNNLTIFYDGNCPMCVFEMQKLKQHDDKSLLKLVNIHGDGFSKRYPHINIERALQVLHGEYQGELLLALDVTHRAWTLVGLGRVVAPLQYPIIKQVSHLVYLVFAKYRKPISLFLHQRLGIGVPPCKEGVCYVSKNNNHYRGK